MSDSSNFMLQEAIALQKAGAVDEAFMRFQSIVRSEPRNVDALFMLGASYMDRKLIPEACDALKKVVRIAPAHAAGHRLYGRALATLGHTDDALKEFHRAFTARPDFIEAYRDRAALLAHLGRHDDAVETLDRALAATSPSADLLSERGLMLGAAHRHADALASYDRALALAPGSAGLHGNRGNALAALDRHEEAVASYAQAVAIDPNLIGARVNMGNSLRQLLRFTEAIEQYDRAIAIQSDFPVAHFSRGMALLELDRYADANESFARALTADPNIAGTPFAANIFSNRARSHLGLGRHADALADIAEAEKIAGEDRQVLLRNGFLQLLLGQWKEGLPKYENRLQQTNVFAPGFSQLPFPRWTGAPVQNLILVTEQGLGDAVNFACFIPELARKEMRIAVLTSKSLAPLMATVPGVARVATDAGALTGLSDAAWLPLNSLPLVLGTTVDSVPATAPYFAIDDARVSAWKARLGADGFKIGIAWQGNPQQHNDYGRSIALSEFAPLAALPGVRLISLQKRPGSEQIAAAAFGARIETPLDENDVSPEALLDTAALIMNLDLVVTSDSMLAHLTGALNRPGYVALRNIPDWRWLTVRDDSPWYASLRLFRRGEATGWAGVFEKIAQAIRPLTRGNDGKT